MYGSTRSVPSSAEALYLLAQLDAADEHHWVDDTPESVGRPPPVITLRSTVAAPGAPDARIVYRFQPAARGDSGVAVNSEHGSYYLTHAPKHLKSVLRGFPAAKRANTATGGLAGGGA